MNFSFRDRAGNESEGVLKIEVPHWTAGVRILDDSLQLIPGAGKIKKDADSATGYSCSMQLKPGTYQVRTSLENQTESEWFPVRPGRITNVSYLTWEKLDFTPTVPTHEIKFEQTGRKPNAERTNVHLREAEHWSRAETWKNQDGNSSLFFFIRADENKKIYDTFADGLQLLDAAGRLVTDFSEKEKVEKDKKNGWLAFHAQLPAGGYILRRGRSGVLLRHQVIYLCENWQTQVFLKSSRFPSLSTMSLAMSRSGFDGNRDENALAAEAILNAFRYGTSFQVLFNNEKIEQILDVLLDNKFADPWLGILAACAISKLDNELSENQRNDFRVYFSIFYEKLIPFLTREIPQHPDVRALRLPMDQPVVQPFDFPPMLLTCLERIRLHATRYTKTIQFNSLTECVIEDVILNSPWTAWRRLNRQPQAAQSVETQRNDERFPFKKAWARKPKKNKILRFASLAKVFSQNAPPKSPVYFLADEAAHSFDPQAESDESAPSRPSREQQILQHKQILTEAKAIVKSYVQTNRIDDIPEKVVVDSAASINYMLDQVEPEQISRSFNLPLARVENALNNLKLQNESARNNPFLNDSVPAPPGDEALLKTKQAILAFALTRIDTENQTTEQTQTVDEAAETSISNVVGKIQTDAERLWLRAEKAGNEKDFALDVARRLKKYADSLLHRAYFVTLTNERGDLIYGNGAFLLLLSEQELGESVLSAKELKERRARNRKLWEQVLISRPVGRSDFPNPMNIPKIGQITLKRTVIEDRAANNSQTFLNIMRSLFSAPVTSEELELISLILSDLTLYTSLLTYGETSDRSEYRRELAKIIKQLKELN